MKFPHFMAVATVLLATFGVGSAQTSDRCQMVSVEVSAKEVDEGMPVVFGAKLNAVVPTAKPEFKWHITAGTITEGEGTSSITVDTAGLGGQSIEATVSVSGVSTVCSTSATQSVAVLETEPLCGLAFDQFGDIDFEDEKARLDNFVIQLFNQETATGYIFVYAGRRSYEGEAVERLLRAKQYLVGVRKIDPRRIITIDGGYQEYFGVELIIAPQGAAPPSAMPTLSAAEIELTKPRPKATGKNRRH